MHSNLQNNRLMRALYVLIEIQISPSIKWNYNEIQNWFLKIECFHIFLSEAFSCSFIAF
jgi:hypothetical protein